ncbi:unnamed protein product [Echinostoma caproni]|uniref:Uncharacterized protein n=1 Tax=Echinostoma caproni TaxID=27848 RepID=A0A183AVT8_9TREM|nr:unnamed protein product [Echinostoma caproni]
MQSVLTYAFNGLSDPSGAYFVPPENQVRRMSNPSVSWVNPSTSEDWSNPSTNLMVSGRASQDWLPVAPFGPVAPVMSPSSSSSTSSSAHRYGPRAEPPPPPHDGAVSIAVDRGHANLVDLTGPSDRPLKPDFSIPTYPLNHPSGSTCSTQTLASSTCRMPEMDLPSEPCPPCFPSQTVTSDVCFPVHNSTVKFDCDYPPTHSLTANRPVLFTPGISLHSSARAAGSVAHFVPSFSQCNCALAVD